MVLPSDLYPGAMSVKSEAVTTWQRYRSLQLEYAALRVVGRGLFLAMMLMVAFLFVFVRATDLIAGDNEVLIPTVSVAPTVDLGQLATGSFTRTSGAVVSVVGIATLVISALWTSYAVRRGTVSALRGNETAKPSWKSWRTIMVAVVLPVIVLTTWLLTLATSLRRSAWSALVGQQLDPALVNGGKALAIALGALIVGGAVVVTIKATMGRVTVRGFVAAAVIAATVVGCNFVLLYTYVGSLINPNVSGGIVLVFALLLWVNIVVRVYLGALGWSAMPRP